MVLVRTGMNAICTVPWLCRRVDRTFSFSSGVTREAKSSGNSKSSVPAQLSPVTLLCLGMCGLAGEL